MVLSYIVSFLYIQARRAYRPGYFYRALTDPWLRSSETSKLLGMYINTNTTISYLLTT